MRYGSKKYTLEMSKAYEKRGEGPLYFALFIKDEIDATHREALTNPVHLPGRFELAAAVQRESS